MDIAADTSRNSSLFIPKNRMRNCVFYFGIGKPFDPGQWSKWLTVLNRF